MDEEEYSDDGGFEAESPLKKVSEKHAATRAEIKSPIALHQESGSIIGPEGTEASSKAQVRPAVVERQATNEIGDEVPLMSENTGESHLGAADQKSRGPPGTSGQAYPR